MHRAFGLLIGLSTILWIGASHAQESGYRRVLVPQKDLPIIGSDFVPIEIDELQRLLEKDRKSFSAHSGDGQAVLSQAVYLADLDAGQLVSYASRYRFDVPKDTVANFDFAKFSAALRPSDVILSDESITEARTATTSLPPFDVDGTASIKLMRNTDLWFGWSLAGAPVADPSKLRFELKYPVCSDCRLFLRLPSGWEVEQSSTVARRLDDLPPGVDDDQLFEFAQRSKSEAWWCLELAGSDSVEFTLADRESIPETGLDQLIQAERTDYRLLPSDLEVSGAFDLMERPSTHPIWRLLVDDGLHVNQITINDRPVVWAATPHAREIEIIEPESIREMVGLRKLKITGSARWPLISDQSGLPKFRIKNGFALEGATAIAVHPDWQVEDPVKPGISNLKRLSSERLTEFQRWEATWSGIAPNFQLKATMRELPGEAFTLSRLSNEADGLVCASRFVFDPKQVLRSSIQLTIQPGWVVESIQSVDRKRSIELNRNPSTPTDHWEIDFSPAFNSPVELDIRCRYAWQSPVDSNIGTEQTFEGDFPLIFEGGRVKNFAWIEPIGRYKLEANIDLASCRINESQIPSFFRTRLPSISDIWLVEVSGRAIPRLEFIRQVSPYNTSLQVLVQPGMNSVVGIYQLTCTPLAGSVSSVSMDIPGIDSQSIKWRRRLGKEKNAENWKVLDTRRMLPRDRNVGNRDSSQQPVRVELDSPLSETFELEGRFEIVRDSIPMNDPAFEVDVPLATFPEAAQQEAVLAIDRRLRLIDGVNNSPFAASGYIRLDERMEAERYRYNPIRTPGVKIGSRASDSPRAWLSNAAAHLSVYADGCTELTLHAHCRSRQLRRCELNLQEGWSLREARMGQTLLGNFRTTTEPKWTIFLPELFTSASGRPLTIVLDGPRVSLHHRMPIEFPDIGLNAEIVSLRKSIHLPIGFRVSNSSMIDESIQSIWSRFLPSEWSRNLFSQPGFNVSEHFFSDAEETLSSKSFYIQSAWTSDSEVFRLSEAPKSTELNIVSREGETAEAWLSAFTGFSIAICIGSRSRHWMIVGFFLSIGCLWIMPTLYLSGFQNGTLGWLLALLLRFFGLGRKITKASSDTTSSITSQIIGLARFSGSATHSVTKGPGSSIASRILPGFFVAITSVSSAGLSDEKSASNPTSFDIVIPVDDQGEVASSVVYVNQDVLTRFYRRPIDEASNRILSADYELRHIPSLPMAIDRTQCVFRLRLDIAAPAKAIVWPLRSTLSEFVSMSIDGVDIALGSRLKWDGDQLTWLPSKMGPTELELITSPLVERANSGRESAVIEMLPVAHARMVIESDDMVQLLSNAVGKFSTLRSGRYEIELGAIDRLNLSWRAVTRSTRSTALKASLATELVLYERQPIARTLIELVDGGRPWEELDLECNDEWLPVGKRWGEALLIRTTRDVSNARTRYRVRRRDNSLNVNSKKSTIEVFWTPKETSDEPLKIPIVELPMIPVEDIALRVMQTPNRGWNMNGIQGWNEAPTSIGFDWQPGTTGDVREFQSTSRAGEPYLYRVEGRASIPAKVYSSIQFGLGQAISKTTVSFGRPVDLSSGLVFDLRDTDVVRRVRCDATEVIFHTSKGESGRMRLQLFPDTNNPISVVEIELCQDFAGPTWSDIPLPLPLSVPMERVEVEGFRCVNRYFEWSGVQDFLNVSQATVGRPIVSVWKWIEELPGSLAETESKDSVISPINLRSKLPRYREVNRQPQGRGRAVMSLSRAEDQWKFQLRAELDATPRLVDGILIELPTTLAARFECSHRSTILTSPEAGRTLVYIFADKQRIPEQTIENKPFDFDFSAMVTALDGSSTTSFPDVRLLGDVDWDQRIMLPRRIEDQQAQWLWSGARIDESENLRESFPFLSSYDPTTQIVLAPTTSRPRVRLGSIISSQVETAVSLADHRLRVDSDGSTHWRSTFWLIPRGRQNIILDYPSDWDFQTANANGRLVDFHNEYSSGTNSKKSILLRLHSAAMPQRVNVYFSSNSPVPLFSLASDGSNLPMLRGARAGKSILSGNINFESCPTLQSISQAEWLTIESTTSWEVVENAAGIIAEVPLEERTQWWSDWQFANANVWLRAIAVRDQSVFDQINERRRKFCDRFQLRAAATTDLPGDILSEVRRVQALQHYVVLDTKVSKNGAEAGTDVVHPLNRGRTFAALTTVLWGAGLMAGAFWVHRKSVTHLDDIQSFLQCRPWWIWIIVGLAAFAILPSSQIGAWLIAIGLLFAIRAFRFTHRR
jgi:hypothetical protein